LEKIPHPVINFSLPGKRGITKNENAAQLCSWWLIKFTQKILWLRTWLPSKNHTIVHM